MNFWNRLLAQNVPDENDRGVLYYDWKSFNYYPFQRGKVWLFVFLLFFFGAGVSFILWGNNGTSDIIMASTFFLMAGVYLYIHGKGHEEHFVKIYEKGFLIDRSWLPIEKFSGFWFVYDGKTVAVLNLQFKEKDSKISLQMSGVTPDEFRGVFRKMNFPELSEKKESLLDLWIRVLKL